MNAVFIILTMIISSCIVLFSYRQGISDGRNMEGREALKPVVKDKAVRKKTSKTENAEAARIKEGISNMVGHCTRHTNRGE